MKLLKSKTDQIRGRYNRIAFLYNSLEAPMEYLRFRNWRNRLMKMISGPSALEVGVGTGTRWQAFAFGAYQAPQFFYGASF